MKSAAIFAVLFVPSLAFAQADVAAGGASAKASAAGSQAGAAAPVLTATVPSTPENEVNAVLDPTSERVELEQGKLNFYAAVVGGVHVETLQLREDNPAEDRTTTVALSRFGLRGRLAGGIYLESEFEVNGGPHGTSVWEGQAALQVRNQLIRLERGNLRVEAGRITDDSSLDYFSAHTTDQLLTDPYTRNPVLASGFNRGQGVLARYEVLPGLRPGLTFNAANPTSTTASLVIGGTFPPFSRFYLVPHQQVGRDASSLPADTYHIAVLTPSVTYSHRLVEAQSSVQMFRVNTDTSTDADENIVGYNVRAGAKLKLVDDRLHTFLSGSRVTNSVVEADDGNMLSNEAFTGYTVNGGLDLNILGRNGVGIQYAFLRGQQGNDSRSSEHYLNFGGTYWLTDTTSIGSRFSLFRICAESAGEGCQAEGARSFYLSMRTVL